VIADLVGRRDEVLADVALLSSKLETAVSDHRPAEGADPFAEPKADESGSGEEEPGEEESEEESGKEPGGAEAKAEMKESPEPRSKRSRSHGRVEA
jgi:hypothetical protein